MVRTLDQNAKFHSLLTLRKFDKEDKAAMVELYTGGRTTSSKEMTADEMKLAIQALEDDQTASMKRMRAKVIGIARDIFELGPKDTWMQSHYDSLNVFLKSKFKNELSRLDYKTLVKAVTAMEGWRKTEMKNMVNNLLNGN